MIKIVNRYYLCIQCILQTDQWKLSRRHVHIRIMILSTKYFSPILLMPSHPFSSIIDEFRSVQTDKTSSRIFKVRKTERVIEKSSYK